MRPIGYQLYSSRTTGDLPGLLTRLADLGYAKVEGYGALLEGDIASLAAILRQTGLTMPSCHIPLSLMETDPDRVMTIAEVLGIRTIVIPYLAPDDRPSTAAGWAALAGRVARAAGPFRARGRHVAWHNHDFELHALGDGSHPLDHLLATDPDLLVELDLGWVAAVGADPATWIARLAPRLHAVHLKDLGAPGVEGGWADIGHGRLDWATLLTQLSATKVRHLIVEHDAPASDSRFARRSIAHLQQIQSGRA